jgi:hypothetical protein
MEEPLIKGPNDYPASSLQGNAQVAEEPQVEGEEEETDEEWDKAEVALKRILFDGGAINEIVKRVAKSDDPAAAIADSAMTVLKSLDEMTQGQIPEDYLLPLATMLVGEIAEALEASGRDVPSEELAMAMKMMLEQHMAEFGASPEEIQQFTSTVKMEDLVKAMDAARAEADGPEEEKPEEEMAEEQPAKSPLIPAARG